MRGESVATLHGVVWCNYSTRLSEPRPPGLSRDVCLHSFVSTRTERTSRVYSRGRYCPNFHLRKRTPHFCPFRNPNPKMGSMDAYEQVEKGPLKLKGVPELGVTKRKQKDRDKSKLLQMMGKIQKNQEEELRRHLDKRTPAQAAFEKVQETRQMERVLKKASTTHKQRVEDFNRHLDTLSEHYDIPKVSWTKQPPHPGDGVLSRGSRKQGWAHLWSLWKHSFTHILWSLLLSPC